MWNSLSRSISLSLSVFPYLLSLSLSLCVLCLTPSLISADDSEHIFSAGAKRSTQCEERIVTHGLSVETSFCSPLMLQRLTPPAHLTAAQGLAESGLPTAGSGKSKLITRTKEVERLHSDRSQMTSTITCCCYIFQFSVFLNQMWFYMITLSM